LQTLEGQDILAFTFADWHASWSTPQQIMARLAPANRVLFVDQPRSFLFGLKGRDPQGAGHWEGPRLQEVQPGLFVYHAPHAFLPVGRVPFPLGRQALRLNGRLMAGWVRAQMRHLGMRDPILWNFSPLHGTAVDHLPRSLTLYDICDEWENYLNDESGKKTIAWIEERMCREVDLIFVGTENMRSRRTHLNPEIQVVHHGADYEHFATALDPATQVPEDIRDLPRPIVGAVGVMDAARFDTELILHLSAAFPQGSVLLVGPARSDLDLTRLQSCGNVYLTGNRPIADLPAYLKGMDVAIIPYKMNEATANIYPLKLQEYLAAGKPVVSPPMPAVLPYREVVGIADGPEAFVRCVQTALEEDGPARREARQAVARQNSWEQRVAEKSQQVRRLLDLTRKKKQGAKRE